MSTQPADPIVILSYARTPMGGFQGVLSSVKATDLGAAAVKAAVERAGVAPGQACVLYAPEAPSRVLGGGFIMGTVRNI